MDNSIEYLEQKIDNLELLIKELIVKMDGMKSDNTDLIGNMEDLCPMDKKITIDDIQIDFTEKNSSYP